MDQSEFRTFYKETAPALRAYICRSCGSLDLADDILQDTFIRFLRAAPPGLDDKAQRAYLYRTAERVTVDHWRKGKRQRGLLERFIGEKAYSRNETAGDTSRIFRQLKPRDRSLLWLAYVEGFDHREIAAASGVNEKSVRVMLFRARQAFEELLRRAGLAPEKK